MKNISVSKTILLTLALTATVVLPRLVSADEKEYSFKVHNTTEHTITELMVSQDGEKWGKFDIGDGIKAGETEKLVWDTATNNQSCHQYFKAEFDDGSESKPKKFDFCEEGLELAF